MKNIMQWISRFIRIAGGMLAALLMLVGAAAAAKKIREWMRSG